MICRKCGAEIPDRKVFCPVCGNEIMLVEEYDSIDMIRAKKKQAEEAVRRDTGRKKRTRLVYRVWKASYAAVIAVALTFFCIARIRGNNEQRPEYLRLRAEQYAAAGAYEEAAFYCEKALTLSRDSEPLYSLLADYYAKCGQNEKSISVLREMYERFGGENHLRLLIRACEESGDAAAVAELLRNTENSGIHEEYSSYLAAMPEFSLVSGKTYPYGTTLTISCASGLVRYTVDGTVPDADSTVYTEPIPLKAGNNRISAAAFNEYGVRGPVVSGVFPVKIRQAAASVIRRSDDNQKKDPSDPSKEADGTANGTEIYEEDADADTGAQEYDETDEAVSDQPASDGSDEAADLDPVPEDSPDEYGDGQPVFEDEPFEGGTDEEEEYAPGDRETQDPSYDDEEDGIDAGQEGHDGREIEYERIDYDFEETVP